MPKTQKIIERVFADIAPNEYNRAAYDNFLDLTDNDSDRLTELKVHYSSIIKDCQKDIKVLAQIEEVIIQIRCKDVIETEMRLSMNNVLKRSYIYARTLFYRRGAKINDIRVMIGKSEDYGNVLNTLIENPAFRNLCKEKLLDAMNKEIEKNLTVIDEKLYRLWA